MTGGIVIIEETDYWARASKKDIDALVCTTNNIIRHDGSLVMGAGIAKQFKETFPYLDLNWGVIVDGLKDGGHEDYHILIDGPRRWQINSVYLVALQTKRHWQDPSPLDLVVESCHRLKLLADIMNWSVVLMTPPGCGNGKLEWKQVKKAIKFLDDRFIIVDNGTHNGKL